MQDIWDLILYNFVGILVVFARITGIFIFNPIMARATVPAQVRVAMSFVLTFVMVGALGDVVGFIPQSLPHFVGVLVLEAVLGFFFGFIVNMFLNVIIYAGKVMDFQISFAMAEAFDPSSGVTMPLMGSLYYYIFVFYFFLAGGHLTYINLFHMSYQIIPVGFQLTNEWREMSLHIAYFFWNILTLAVKLALPLIVSQMVLQISVGVIMKAVPAIQIFIVNLQMRVLVGLLLIVMVTPAMSDFLHELMDLMFQSLFGALYTLGG
jgi:flagellar biosynthetic protein FliR